MSINFHEYVASLREDHVMAARGNYFSDNFSYSPSSNHLKYDRSLFVYQPSSQQSQQSQQQQQQLPQKQLTPNKIRIKLLKAQRLNFEEKSEFLFVAI